MSNSVQDRSEINKAAELDDLVRQITDHVANPPEFSQEAMDMARLCLLDSLGCAFAALQYPDCIAYLGPVVSGGTVKQGARVIGTGVYLDPLKAAFDNGTLIRWLDFNDTWLASEWGHPSDNLAGLLALTDYRSRNPGVFGKAVKVSELLNYAICAYEIQGVLALDNAFNQAGLDHVLLVRIATAALTAKLAGGNHQTIASAVSNAWIDGSSLRTYRHAPNTSQRKSWAAGDAASRGVRLGLMAAQCGMPVLNSAISARQWGFADVSFSGKIPTLPQPFGCYVMENVLFKVSFPAEFHAQTAVECAIVLHSEFMQKRNNIARIELTTQESAIRIISKTGELRNFADRDHCLQYMVAIGLLEGCLLAEHYADDYPRRTQADELRKLMTVKEDRRYSRDYLDPHKRSIANAVQLIYDNGEKSEKIEIEYPLGHRHRREEALPKLQNKFKNATADHLGSGKTQELLELFSSQKIDELFVSELIDLCAGP